MRCLCRLVTASLSAFFSGDESFKEHRMAWCGWLRGAGAMLGAWVMALACSGLRNEPVSATGRRCLSELALLFIYSFLLLKE